jgi:hypothetical protein
MQYFIGFQLLKPETKFQYANNCNKLISTYCLRILLLIKKSAKIYTGQAIERKAGNKKTE